MAMTAATIKTTESVIRWYYLPWALLAIAVMVAAIVVDNLWFLDYVHVFSSLLWTGIDLFTNTLTGVKKPSPCIVINVTRTSAAAIQP